MIIKLLKFVYHKLKKLEELTIYPIINLITSINNKKIIFNNFFGKGYGDNPKYICDEFLRRNEGYDLVWVLKNMNDEVPDGVRKVKFGSIKSIYERASSKVIVSNIRNYHPIKKKEGQIYLQTWHGPHSFKLVEKDAEDKLSPQYIEFAKYDGSICDGLISDSEQETELYKRAFWLKDKVEILKIGMPRNDNMIRIGKNSEEKLKLRNKYNFNDDICLILYAPTFRDDGSFDCYKLDIEKIIQEFENKLNNECKLIVRMHPNASEFSKKIEYNEKILNGTFYPDMQELSLMSDYLISDYSSTLIDFLVLDKPAFICALDYDSYVSQRGLTSDFMDFPFIYSFSNEELLDKVKNFDYGEWLSKISKYKQEHPFCGNGNSSKKAVDWIISRI